MTLDTAVRVAGDIDHKELFYLSIAAILDAANRDDILDSVRVEFQEKGHIPSFITDNPLVDDDMRARWASECDEWHTKIGQGLPGIVQVQKCDGYYEISWDTAYSYNVGGLGCTELHVSAMLFLENSLPEGVQITEWRNEYSMEWNDATYGIGPGVEEFLGTADRAMKWFDETLNHIMTGAYPRKDR